MAVASTTDLITMFPELASVSSGTLQLYLDDAKLIIESEGVSSSHIRFSQLQRYKTASIIAGMGLLASDTTGEAVADVSISKTGGGFNNDSTYTNKYERLYRESMINVLGMTDKLK